MSFRSIFGEGFEVEVRMYKTRSVQNFGYLLSPRVNVYKMSDDPLSLQTVTGFSSPVILSSDEYFPKADQFIPERWLHGASADVKSTHPFAFLPFSFGSRNCVGKRFAEMELETIVAKVSSFMTRAYRVAVLRVCPPQP